jgi:site-specific recombinase XerD
MDELEHIGPDEALDYYLDHREREVSAATLRSHESRLKIFVGWCKDNGIDNLNDLTGRKLHEYRLWRRDYNGGLKPVSEKTQMATLRVFIRFLESIDGVRQDLSQKVQSPNLDTNEDVREVMLARERAETILDYLDKYEYATRPHIVLALEWHTMMRRGAVHALDVQDYNSDEQSLEVLHRPETGTALKNKDDGERMVALQPELCDLLDDWIEHQRPDVTDDYGREPLVATEHGRIHTSTVTTIVYNWTRPCIIGEECPVNRDPDECDAAHYGVAYECPDSVSSHAVRRGSITHNLESDVPAEVVSGRANVGPDILNKHYDQRSERSKMEQRRKYLRNL